LRGNQGHAENLAGNLGGFLGGTRQLDAATFAAATCVDLRLDNANVGFQALRGLQCFFLGESDVAAGSGDAITREYCSWIFMKVSVLPFRLETVSQC
jgi:hypothetical protein